MQILKVNIKLGCCPETYLFDVDHINRNLETKLTFELVCVTFGVPPLHATLSSTPDLASLCTNEGNMSFPLLC